MAVNLSPVGGVAGQFFDNNGDPLVGGKLFTYAAGTTTPQVTFTSSSGGTPNSNPIILNAGGRVPSEIWLTDGLVYKFVLYSSTDQLIGSWDNIIGINSNFVNFVTSEEVQIATAGQTVFTLTTMQYQPGLNNLVVYVDGVNQVEGGSYSFVETNSTTVTFTAGLHLGAVVKFVSAEAVTTIGANAAQVAYEPAGSGAVTTTVQTKLRETVSVKDFGAVGDGVTDDTAAIQAAANYLSGVGSGTLWFPPKNTFRVTNIISVSNVNNFIIDAEGSEVVGDFDLADSALNTQTGMFTVSGVGVTNTTTLASTAAVNSTTITVANAAGIVPGSMLNLFSSGEYWSGIAGVAGYQLVFVSESVVVRSVSGTTITLESPLTETFTVTPYTVTVQVIQRARSIKIKGNFVGPGQGSDYTSPTGPTGFRFNYCDDVEINGSFRNWNSAMGRLHNCTNARGSYFLLGRDNLDVTNLPNISEQFSGLQIEGGFNFSFGTIVAQNARRPMDWDVTSVGNGATIPSNISVSSLTAIGCVNGIGGHYGRRISVGDFVSSGNSASVYFRGKHLSIANAVIDSTATAASSAALLFGGDNGTNYAENPSVGVIDIGNLVIFGRFKAILVRVSAEKFTVGSITHTSAAGDVIEFRGKSQTNIFININKISNDNYVSGVRYGILFANIADRLSELHDIKIQNGIIAITGRGVTFEAPSNPDNAAYNLQIEGVSFLGTGVKNDSTHHVDFVSGAFGINNIVKNCTFAPSRLVEVAIHSDTHLFQEIPAWGDNVFLDVALNNNRVVAHRVNTTLPDKTSVRKGDKITNSVPTAGSYSGWVALNSGTIGSISGAPTGAITSGSANLTVSTNASNQFFVGAFITIAGAGTAGADLVTQIVSGSGTSWVVLDNAETTVATAAISYTTPVWKGFAEIEA